MIPRPKEDDTILVTGGAGFIGSAVVRLLLSQPHISVLNFDSLTYAANPVTLQELNAHPRHCFIRGDIRDQSKLEEVFGNFKPTKVFHLAAESHVDRSIDAPASFLNTNIVGTHILLDTVTKYWGSLGSSIRDKFRFVHVSTDEVYGTLGSAGKFSENSAYRPNSPYAATKAGSDHLVRAWNKTFGLPTIISHASNNYGPYQAHEKLIPRVITRALKGKPIEIYGRGDNVRDWLHVNDHAKALWALSLNGHVGETYNVGSSSEWSNLRLVNHICEQMDVFLPKNGPHRRLIVFVEDRPGHDFRYAIDNKKITTEIGWAPSVKMESGLKETIKWYIDNPDWWSALEAKAPSDQRLGILPPSGQH